MQISKLWLVKELFQQPSTLETNNLILDRAPVLMLEHLSCNTKDVSRGFQGNPFLIFSFQMSSLLKLS